MTAIIQRQWRRNAAPNALHGGATFDGAARHIHSNDPLDRILNFEAEIPIVPKMMMSADEEQLRSDWSLALLLPFMPCEPIADISGGDRPVTVGCGAFASATVQRFRHDAVPCGRGLRPPARTNAPNISFTRKFSSRGLPDRKGGVAKLGAIDRLTFGDRRLPEHEIARTVDRLDRFNLNAPNMKHRKLAGRGITPNDNLIAIQRQPGNLEFDVVLVRPEPWNLRVRRLSAANGGRRLLGLLQSVGHAFKTHLAFIPGERTLRNIPYCENLACCRFRGH